MGCDIHAFVEYRQPKGDEGQDPPEWRGFREAHLERDYEMFGLLAGVRSLVDPIADPRGLPPDIGFWTQCGQRDWQADMHTPTWLTFEEYAEVVKRACGRISHPYERVTYVGLLGLMTALVGRGCDVRLVLWFDN